MLNAFVLHCPELGRSLDGIRAAVPDVQALRAPRTANGHDGCIAAHQDAVRIAVARAWPSVWVIEDDCAFTSAFSRDRWEADADWTRAHGYGVLAGGCFSVKNPRLIRDGLLAVDRFKSSHCVVYHQAAYDTVLRVTEPIDLMLGTLGARCAVAFPFVAVQAPGFSGTLERSVDNGDGYVRCENRLAGLTPTRRGAA